MSSCQSMQKHARRTVHLLVLQLGNGTQPRTRLRAPSQGAIEEKKPMLCKGLLGTPGGIRTPNRGQTVLVPTSMTQSRFVMSCMAFRWSPCRHVPPSTIRYHGVGLQNVVRSQDQIPSVGDSTGGGTARSVVACQRPPWSKLRAFARQGVTMLNQKFDPRSSSEPISSPNLSRLPST
jgi:hypothetical protein